MLYNFLDNIRSNEWIEYGIVGIFVMFLVTKIIKPTALQIVALIIASIIIYYRIDRRKATIENAYDELDYRIKMLTPKPENFHMDADLISLYYNTREFRKYHSEGYDESLVAVDNMLKIISEIEANVVFHCKENLDVIKDQNQKALNHYHSIIYKLPPTSLVFQRKHKRALNALQIILRRHIDAIVQRCRKYYKDRGVDIDYHEIHNSGPKPSDQDKADKSDFDFYY
jgi:hypothetical protein